MEGYREVLSVAVKSSEAKVNWREFLGDLKQRGMCSVQMITSDAHLKTLATIDICLFRVFGSHPRRWRCSSLAMAVSKPKGVCKSQHT